MQTRAQQLLIARLGLGGLLALTLFDLYAGRRITPPPFKTLTPAALRVTDVRTLGGREFEAGDRHFFIDQYSYRSEQRWVGALVHRGDSVVVWAEPKGTQRFRVWQLQRNDSVLVSYGGLVRSLSREQSDRSATARIALPILALGFAIALLLR